ncbi:MAG: OadG family protein [Methylococcales symbiont of Hymedesmia sp. n. MRB-2018]|nr:MAG: OadG family protein [Methylococcales symbiont of Hymedesmia sp. n. MRB-2018]
MNEIMSAGVELMIIGMVIVFAFLAMLVVMVNIMTWVVQRFFPAQPITITPIVSASTSHTDASVIAAITATVHQYRDKHK